MNKPLAAALVLSFAAFAGPAAAEESLSSRAASAVGAVIASQGNAALVQIRQELKETLLEQLRPWLPQPAGEKPVAAPADRAETEV